MPPIRDKIKEFLNDPLGKAIEWWVYLLILGIGLAILIGGIRWFISFMKASLS